MVDNYSFEDDDNLTEEEKQDLRDKEVERQEWINQQLKRISPTAVNKSKSKSKGKQRKEEEEEIKAPKKVKYLRKYTDNGTGPLFESAIIGKIPTFVTYAKRNGDYTIQPFKYIEGSGQYDIHPAETIASQNPIPYTFDSIDELKQYIELAKKETFGTLFFKVKSVFSKYVNVEEYYATVLSADIVYSWFQDKFGTTQYNIFTGDNGSGKNSALLVFKYLGYRVFYVVAASAPNYFTFLGDLEECQGSIAEDEAEDMAYNHDKNKVIKTGYCSGATVPKVDLSFGRKQESWLTYCHKWFAMEELPDYKRIKGILDRSFVYNFVVGTVDYNIKDVTSHSGDSKHKSLYEEIIDLRKLLFAFRLLRYDDSVPDIKLNVIHRNEELTKPLLRLFSYRNDSAEALDEIRLALSKFVLGRNETKKNSIESKLLDAVNNLIHSNNMDKGIDGSYLLYNDHLRAEVRGLMEAVDIPNKTEAFYSPEHGAITHKKITAIYKSKFKAESFVKRDDDRTRRGLRFSKDVLDKLALYYDVPTEIKIITPNNIASDVTHVTDVTHLGPKKGMHNDNSDSQDHENHAQIASDVIDETTQKDPQTPPNTPSKCKTVRSPPIDKLSPNRGDTEDNDNLGSVTSVTNFAQPQPQPQPIALKSNAYWNRDLALWCCQHCKHKGDKFDMTNHVANCRMRIKKSGS
jgi:hypothetical protein